MTGRAPSRQELIRRRRQSGFVGRQGELAAFRDALTQAPDEAQQFLFHIHGPAGVGKSTLVRQLETAAREAQALTAYVDESAADVFEAMEAISLQLAQQGLAMKGFDRLLATYRQRRHEAVASATGADAGAGTGAGAGGSGGSGGADQGAGGQGAGGQGPSAAGVVASQLGLMGLSLIPGVGMLAGAVDPNQVAAGADRFKAVLSARLRSHEDVQLVLSPLNIMAPVFLQELAEAARRRPWVALFFDTYERLGPLLDVWLRNMVVSDRYGELPSNVLVVLAGQRQLDVQCWGDWLDLVTDLALDVFSDAEARQLLAAKGITDEHVVEVILHLSGRLPVLVSTLAEGRPGSVREVGDPSGTAVERFLKWETDPARRGAALACAFPQSFDEDVYRSAVGGGAAGELFGWLRSMPFVTDRAGRCQYHDVVRTAMLRLQRRQSPERWQEQHTRLADAFAAKRARVERGTRRGDGAGRGDGARRAGGIRREEGVDSADGWWQDERWRGHRLQETYHRLCADPRAALADALRESVDAYGHATTTLRRWAETLTRAGEDADSSAVLGWGRRLLTALEEPLPGIAALSLLLTSGELGPAGRFLAYTLRGRDHRNADQYGQALADYNAALVIEPESARAFRGRGETYRYLEQFDAALADFGRALALDPGNSWAFSRRGETYRYMGRGDEALADFDRALALDPEFAWAVASRGETYDALRQFDASVADFTRALAISPRYTWAMSNRGRTYGAMGRYDDALADFDRAIEINPEYAWALANRGKTYGAMGRYDEALADFDRALGINPDYVWALTNRGIVHRVLGRLDASIADLTRAIDLNPNGSWAISARGTAYRLTDRLDAALADHQRALELAPDSPWVLTGRGAIHRRMGRYDEALADIDGALALDSAVTWAHYEKLAVLQALGHPDRDAHYARVVALLDAPAAGVETAGEVVARKGNLFLAHCVTSRWAEAAHRLADFLTAAPARGEILELRTALTSLTPIVPSAPTHFPPLHTRLNGALP